MLKICAIKKIVITGPESSGKSTLAKTLAEEFNTVFVPEYARIYLAAKSGEYDLVDIVNIGIGQLALTESIQAANVQPFLFIDTWMLELRIWAKYRFGVVPDVLEQMYHEHLPDFYVLCSPDLPWEPDPLRENPHDRDELFELYRKSIQESALPCSIISGIGAEREKQALEAIRLYTRTINLK